LKLTSKGRELADDAVLRRAELERLPRKLGA
jgi:hypothetical protein